MRRIFILMIITAALGLAVSYIPKAVNDGVQESGAVKPSYELYADSVSAVGQIENNGEYKITSPVPLIISSFSAQKGEYVNSGDEVAAIDTEATKSYLYTLSGDDKYATLLGSYDVSAISTLIPEKLYAQKSGIVAEIDAEVGEAVMPDSPIMRIINDDNLVATISVNEADAGAVKAGQFVSLSCKAITDNEYLGTVESISPTAHKKYIGTTTETVVDVLVKLNDTKLLKSGYSVSAKITTSDSEVVCSLPYEAIKQDEKGEFVYVLNSGKCLRKDIKTGRDLPHGEEITDGIDENDIVLTGKDLKQNDLVKVKNGLNKNWN